MNPRILIWLCILLVACSPQKELARIARNHPEYFKDTVITRYKHDTLITKEIRKDSVINNITSKDTVFIREGKATVKYVYMTGNRGYISARVAPDTVVKIDTVKSNERTIVKEVRAPKTGFEIFSEWAIVIILIIVVGKYVGIPILKTYIPKFPL